MVLRMETRRGHVGDGPNRRTDKPTWSRGGTGHGRPFGVSLSILSQGETGRPAQTDLIEQCLTSESPFLFTRRKCRRVDVLQMAPWRCCLKLVVEKLGDLQPPGLGTKSDPFRERLVRSARLQGPTSLPTSILPKPPVSPTPDRRVTLRKD